MNASGVPQIGPDSAVFRPETRAEGDVRSESPRTADGDTGAVIVSVPPGGSLLGDVLVRCGLRLDMGVRDIERRLALSDDDLAVLERVRGLESAGYDAVRPGQERWTSAGILLDYLLTGEAS